MNVVTTLPSATEIVCALDHLPVGVSHGCTQPPAVRELPSVTSSRVDADASSGEIDEQVLETADEGVYEIDRETLAALEPELIVTQGICDVCAVDEAVVERAVARIDGADELPSIDPEILTTDPHTVDDVLSDVERIGLALGREERARAVIADLEGRLEAVRERASATATRPRVAVLDWTNPPMVAGHWVPELLAAAGGEYGLADPGDSSTPREWAELRAYDPEVLIVAPCGFDLEQTRANLSDLTDREGWDELAAVREGRVWAVDGDRYVNQPGPGIVDTAEQFARIVHPGAFDAPSADVAVPFTELALEA